MRSIFSIIGLLLVLAIVGLVAKKQLTNTTTVIAPATTSNGITLPATTLGAAPQQQSQEIQQQVKQQVETAMQQARPVPDDK